MADSMLSFVLSHLPSEWDEVPVYTRSTLLFTLSSNSHEYQKIESLFCGAHVDIIQRVQNPYQFGRFMLRREMVNTTYENIVFHGVHRADLDVALKFNCDYRRYKRRHEGIYENGQHPLFYCSFSDLLNNFIHPITDLVVLVLKILTNEPQTQCDYYIQYVVKF